MSPIAVVGCRAKRAKILQIMKNTGVLVVTDLALSSLSIKIEDLPSRPKQLGETEQDDVLGGRGYRNPRAYAYYMRRSQAYSRGARNMYSRARSYQNAANRYRSYAMRFR